MLCGVFAIRWVLYQLWERQSKQSKSQPPCDLSLVKEMIPSVRSDKVVWGRVWTEKEGGDEISRIGSVCVWRGGSRVSVWQRESRSQHSKREGALSSLSCL